MKQKKIYIIIGAITLGFVSYSTISANVPKIYSPFSFTVVIPVFFLYDMVEMLPPFLKLLPFMLSCALIPLFYIGWSYRLYSGACKIPRRSIILFSITIILSLIYLISSWNYGVAYQGLSYTIAMYALNLIFWIVMILLFRINRKTPSFKLSFIFHWISFAWLAWVSFPWLGELLW